MNDAFFLLACITQIETPPLCIKAQKKPSAHNILLFSSEVTAIQRQGDPFSYCPPIFLVGPGILPLRSGTESLRPSSGGTGFAGSNAWGNSGAERGFSYALGGGLSSLLAGTMLVVSREVVPVLALLEVKGDSSLGMRR